MRRHGRPVLNRSDKSQLLIRRPMADTFSHRRRQIIGSALRTELSPGGRSKQSEAYRRKQGAGVGGTEGGLPCTAERRAFPPFPPSPPRHMVCGLRRRRRKSSENQQPRRAGAVFPPAPLSGGRREFIFFSFPRPAGAGKPAPFSPPPVPPSSRFRGATPQLAPNRRPAQRVVRCKAHRKGQGEGVFSYVEPHLRSNAAAGGYLRRAFFTRG